MRVALIIIGSVLLLFVLGVGAVYLWWQRHGDAFIEDVQDAGRAGEAYGRSHTALECHERALSIMHDCTGMSCDIGTSVYATMCHAAATDSGGLCDQVPIQPGVFERLTWVTQQCALPERQHSACQHVMEAALAYCDIADADSNEKSSP